MRIPKKILCIPSATVAIMLSLAVVASAQWDPYPWKRVPRTADARLI